MSIVDIYEAIYTSNNGDIKETLQDLTDLRDDIQKSPYIFIAKLENYIRAKAETTNKCPKCFGDMSLIRNGTEVYEYQGTPISEPIHAVVCKECGYAPF